MMGTIPVDSLFSLPSSKLSCTPRHLSLSCTPRLVSLSCTPRHVSLTASFGGGGGPPGIITDRLGGGGGGGDNNNNGADKKFYWVKVRGDMAKDIEDIFSRYLGDNYQIDFFPYNSYGHSAIDNSYRSITRNIFNIWGAIFGVGLGLRGVRELSEEEDHWKLEG